MGREWLHWVSGKPSTRRRRPEAAGCMCAVFQLFDLHHFQLPLNHQHSYNLHPPNFLEEELASSAAGVEAPRNSLEEIEIEIQQQEEEPIKQPSNPPFAIKQLQPDNLNFPVDINQIKTRASRTEDLAAAAAASDCDTTNSPGTTKTPNLVARLMGLDLLPECSTSPSSNPNPQTKSHLHQKKRSKRCFSDDDISVGARSLPETPRTSSSRRSDVDHHHRLSLQINKERITEEFVGRRGRGFRKQDENCNSPRNYAKQIVKQVKESVSRRVGLLDITNTNNKDEHGRRDQNLLLIKLHKKSPKLSPKLEGEISPDLKQSKLKFLDSRRCSRSVTDAAGIKSCSKQVEQQNDCSSMKAAEIGKSGGGGVKKIVDKGMRSNKEDAFVRCAAAAAAATKKSKKKSSELLHISGPTLLLLPVKKDPSPPATKLPLKQVSPDSLSSSTSKRNTQLSCNTSHSYNQISTVLPDSSNGCAAAPEYKSYVNKILKRAGIVDKFTPLTLGKWHTPSHPLDPSIFYYLELFHPAALSRQCNRKLIFQLVDELLVDILRPRLDFKPQNNYHFALGDELCRRIESFPAASCKVLEDIDALVNKDLCDSPLSGCYREEGERLVCEIEGEIVERLVRETVALFAVCTETGTVMSRDEMPLVGVCGNHPRGWEVYQTV